MSNQKFCNFYVSENHLLTVLMPYIDEKIKAKKELIVFSQKDISSDVKKYLKQVKVFEGESEKILNLSWKKCKKEISEEFINKDIAIVIGGEDFINKINDSIDKNSNFYEIINCYNIEEIKNLREICEKYSGILNTTGKFEIIKNSQNAQERKTIKSQL